MGPPWGQTGSCQPQMGPMSAPWTLLSGTLCNCCKCVILEQTKSVLCPKILRLMGQKSHENALHYLQNYVNIGLDTHCQVIHLTNIGILTFEILRTKFSEISIKIQLFSFNLEMSSLTCRSFCPSLNVLKIYKIPIWGNWWTCIFVTQWA